jgi:TatD DNase family protein
MYLDAHNHLHDLVLQPQHDEIFALLKKAQVSRAVVNGTTEGDWAAVAALAKKHPNLIIPSYGLHPWWIAPRSTDWQKNLTQLLAKDPSAQVGEIGLDQWKTPYDPADQATVFLWQYDLARETRRAATIHCLRAWEPLWSLLQHHPVPTRGFLLHAYSGPAAHLPRWVEKGAYFSFSGYFLYPKKIAQRAAFRQVPLDRLLIETDAPSMPLPRSLAQFEIEPEPINPEAQRPHHPANLPLIYKQLAQFLEIDPYVLREQVKENFLRLFCSQNTQNK